jgi:hypothetical protein
VRFQGQKPLIPISLLTTTEKHQGQTNGIGTKGSKCTHLLEGKEKSIVILRPKNLQHPSIITGFSLQQQKETKHQKPSRN